MKLSVNIQRKDFGASQGGQTVLSDVHFIVEEGEIVALFGPSGSGKSTILRMIAGFDSEYRGAISLGDEAITKPCSSIGLCTQSTVACDWLTVRDNLAFPLRYTYGTCASWSHRLFGRVDPAIVAWETKQIALQVGLSLLDMAKYPSALSGGMRQRMALGRSLLAKPKFLLLDEPLGALDYGARLEIQDLLLKIRADTGIAIVIVTHDPEEALYLADRVLLLGGRPAGLRQQISSFRNSLKGDDLRDHTDFLSQKRLLRDSLH